MKFSELKILFKDNFDIDHLADIARELGVSPQAVSNWKSRDQIPYKYVQKIHKKINELVNKVPSQLENKNYVTNQAYPNYGNTLDFEESDFSIGDILLILARQLKIIIITPTIVCVIAIIYALVYMTPVFESSAKIMGPNRGTKLSGISGLAAQFGINMPMDNSEPEWVYPEIIKSRTLARAMLKRKFDTNKYGPQKSLLQILTYGNKEPSIGLDTLIRSGVNGVIGMIKLQNKGSFYELTISAPEPIFARDFAIALIDELDAHQREYNNKKTSEARKFIEARIFDTENELMFAEEKLKNFSIRNRHIKNSPALLLEEQRLSREVAVLTGVFTTLKQQLETTKIQEVRDKRYVVVLDPPEAPLVKTGPGRKRVVILAGFLGIGLGIGLGFLREYIENSDNKNREKIDRVKSLVIQNIGVLIPKRLKNYFQ